jgi:hypothetical protein
LYVVALPFVEEAAGFVDETLGSENRSLVNRGDDAQDVIITPRNTDKKKFQTCR